MSLIILCGRGGVTTAASTNRWNNACFVSVCFVVLCLHEKVSAKSLDSGRWENWLNKNNTWQNVEFGIISLCREDTKNQTQQKRRNFRKMHFRSSGGSSLWLLWVCMCVCVLSLDLCHHCVQSLKIKNLCFWTTNLSKFAFLWAFSKG